MNGKPVEWLTHFYASLDRQSPHIARVSDRWMLPL